MVDINQLKFEYSKDAPLFENISLQIEAGENIGLIGSNGAGKSTLLRLLVGLHEPRMGTIEIDGQKLNRKSIKDLRQKVGFAFQDADSQLFMTTVYEDVAFGPRNLGYSDVEVDLRVKQALKQVEAEHLTNRPPYKLSGGEKRQVTLATVLSMDPKVIALDEPTTGLDPHARRNLIRLLKELPQTKLIATHDMDMALDICDRVVVMHHGKVVMIGKPQTVFKNKDLLDQCHLELPLSLQGCPICSL